MNISIRSCTFALLCAGAIGSSPASVMAQPAFGATAPIASARSSDATTLVQYRGGRYGHRRGYGGNIGLGIGAAIIGGIVLSEAARAEHQSAHGEDWDRCAETYRSFDPSTGLYTGYDGVQRSCPYLR